MEGKKEGWLHRHRKYGRAGVISGVVLLVLLLGTVGFDLTKDEDKEAQKTNSQVKRVVNEGCESEEQNPLLEEENPGIASAIKEYFEALEEKSGFVESYDNIRVYTKQGMYEGTYVAFVRYEMKIQDVYTMVPGLGTVYVEEDKEHGYRIGTSVEDESVKAYIKVIAEHTDVKAVMDETQNAYHEAVASDALLQEALIDLKNAYEDSTGS